MKKFAFYMVLSCFMMSSGIIALHDEVAIVALLISQILCLAAVYGKVRGFLDDETERYEMAGYVPSIISILGLFVTLAHVLYQLVALNQISRKFVGIVDVIQIGICLASIYAIRLFLIKKGLTKKV